MKKLVIFDCDGTLVESEIIGNQVFADMLAEHQIQMTAEEAFQRFKGRKLGECLAEIEKTFNLILPKDFTTDFRSRLSVLYETELRAVEGVAEALRKIPHAKCVASNGPHLGVKRNLEITGLISHFGENIFSAYTIQKWKPDPDLFLHACKTMGSDPAHCVVVEDSEMGVRAARAGGLRVLGFHYPPAQDKNIFPFQHMSALPILIEQLLM